MAWAWHHWGEYLSLFVSDRLHMKMHTHIPWDSRSPRPVVLVSGQGLENLTTLLPTASTTSTAHRIEWTTYTNETGGVFAGRSESGVALPHGIRWAQMGDGWRDFSYHFEGGCCTILCEDPEIHSLCLQGQAEGRTRFTSGTGHHYSSYWGNRMVCPNCRYSKEGLRSDQDVCRLIPSQPLRAKRTLPIPNTSRGSSRHHC